MRFWLSGPRILGIRPGILFRPDELFRNPRGATASQGGFIYIIRDGNEHVKIGVSVNPEARLAILQTGSPLPLALAYAGALRCDGYAIEAAAHETLAHYRMAGEWFNCPVAVAVAAIGAAAHRLGEPIASVEPARVNEVVRAAAMSNGAPEAHKSRFSGWLAAWIILSAAIFYFLNQFIWVRSP